MSSTGKLFDISVCGRDRTSEFEKCTYENKVIYGVPPGSELSLNVTVRDHQRFLDLLSRHSDYRIQINLCVDGQDLGYNKQFSMIYRYTRLVFDFQYTIKGFHAIKVCETSVNETDNLCELKANATRQWNQPTGTILVRWKLVRLIGKEIRQYTPPLPATKEVGYTKKFFERPTAAVELGSKLPDVTWANDKFQDIYGEYTTDDTKVWYHIPSVFRLFKNMSLSATSIGSSSSFVSGYGLSNNTAGVNRGTSNTSMGYPDDGGSVQVLPPPAKVKVVIDLTTSAGTAGSSASKRSSTTRTSTSTNYHGQSLSVKRQRITRSGTYSASP